MADEFDYVVVGGGTAGAVVAARLSEDPTASVCLLEWGPTDVGFDDVLLIRRWLGLLEGRSTSPTTRPCSHGATRTSSTRARRCSAAARRTTR